MALHHHFGTMHGLEETVAERWLRSLPSVSAHGGGVSMLLKTKRPNHVYVPSHPCWQDWGGGGVPPTPLFSNP